MTNATEDREAARRIAAAFWRRYPSVSHQEFAAAIERGEKDDCEAVQVAMLAFADRERPAQVHLTEDMLEAAKADRQSQPEGAPFGVVFASAFRAAMNVRPAQPDQQERQAEVSRRVWKELKRAFFKDASPEHDEIGETIIRNQLCRSQSGSAASGEVEDYSALAIRVVAYHDLDNDRLSKGQKAAMATAVCKAIKEARR